MVGDVELVLLKKDVSREVAGADKLWPFRSSHVHDYCSEGDVIQTSTFCSCVGVVSGLKNCGNAEVS